MEDEGWFAYPKLNPNQPDKKFTENLVNVAFRVKMVGWNFQHNLYAYFQFLPLQFLSSSEYAKRIFDKEYELINDKTEEKRVNELYTILYSKIKGINKSVSAMKINKGTIFKGKRNFCILEKRKYGYNIRLLPVEDTDNILGVVGRKSVGKYCSTFCLKRLPKRIK